MGAMNGENRLLVTDEPIEVQDFRKITHHFKRNIWNIPQINKEKNERCQHVTGWT
jgi:hypothetical protein